jgi:hypothetical protein
MNREELQNLKRLIIQVSAYYDRDLKPEVVSLMASDLEDLPYADVVKAYDSYRRNGKHDRFPLPSVIREMVRPEGLTDDQMAVEIAARIVTAIAKFGWNNAKEAREYVGEIGWAVVNKQAGWERLCEGLRRDNIAVYQAQTRELAKVQIRLAKMGSLEALPPIDQPPAALESPAKISRLLAKMGVIE